MLDYQGKVIIVTGAGAGMGRAAAIEFAKLGGKVVAADVNDVNGQETVAQITKAGGEAIFVHTDVACEADVENMVATAVKTYGRLDVAFNNAGIEGVAAPATAVTHEQFERIFNVNVWGISCSMKHQITAMLANGGGVIVNSSSFLGEVGFGMMSLYAATKHAIVALSQSAALENAKTGVRVLSVGPGVVDTPMLDRFTGGNDAAKAGLGMLSPTEKLISAEAIAKAVVFLASPYGDCIRGTNVLLDEGITAR